MKGGFSGGLIPEGLLPGAFWGAHFLRAFCWAVYFRGAFSRRLISRGLFVKRLFYGGLFVRELISGWLLLGAYRQGAYCGGFFPGTENYTCC